MCKSNKLWRLSKKSEILLFEKSAQKNVFLLCLLQFRLEDEFPKNLG